MLHLDLKLDRPGFSFHVAFAALEPVTGVFGPSGAGKSTLLQLTSGLERPDLGRIELDGDVLFDSLAGTDVPPHRRRVGVVFQDGRLFPHYSVLGNLRYGQNLAREERGPQLPAVVELLALGDLLQRRVRSLSGGERQRVALGRALLAAPRLLLLDEPLASLDQGLKAQIIPFLRKVKDSMGIPMLYVSHDLAEVLQLTRHLVILDRGRVVGQGAFTDLVEETDALAAVEPMGLLNVLELEVRGHEPEHGLTSLAIGPGGGGQLLRGPLRGGATGDRVHAALRPEDIALALGPISGVSIQNQIEGRIARFKSSSGKALVDVDIGTPGSPTPLLVDVSLKTLHDLGIVPGRRVWCLVKANAVRYV